MTKINYETEINAPVGKVFEYYTNPDNIKESWPQDIVKGSENVSGQKSEEGSEMKVKGEYMGKEEEMTLEVVKKEQNSRLVTQQTQGPFKKWESIQEFQGAMAKHISDIRLIMNYPQLEKLQMYYPAVRLIENKTGITTGAQTVKQRLSNQAYLKHKVRIK